MRWKLCCATNSSISSRRHASLSSRFGTYKTVETSYKTVEASYKTVKSRHKTVEARSKTIEARLNQLQEACALSVERLSWYTS